MGQRWRTVIGIAITAVLVWWLVEKGGIDWAQAWVYIRGANPLLLVLSAAVATSIYPLRAIRWRILLDPAAPNVPIGKLWRAIAIGITATNIIGARVGEPVRAYALTREEPRVGFSTGFGSIFADRIFDGIVILLLLVISLPRGQDTALVANSAILATVALIGALAGIYALILVPAKVIAVYHATVGRAIPRFAHHGERILTSFASGLSSLKNPRLVALAFLWALLHWLVNAFSYWIGFVAIGIEAPWQTALFVQALIVLGVALPSTPGFLGIFEGFAMAALVLYGVDRDLALAWAVVYHAVSFVPITVFGLIYVARLGMGLREIASAGRQATGTAPG